MKVVGSFEMRVVPDEPVVRTFVTATSDGFSSKAEGNHMAYTLASDHKIQVQVAYTDAAGNPAAVDTVTWSTSDANTLAVTVDPTDQTIATIQPVGPAGQAQAVATADVDLGAGVTNLLTTMDVAVVAGQAVAGTITPVGDPQPV